MKQTVVVLAVLAAGARQARALDPSTAIAQYNQRVWSLDEGLPQATVTAIAQTPDGHLWVGTAAGLARFDGVTFTVFSRENTPALRNHEVRDLVVDGAGDLWIAVHQRPGILRYRGGSFETFEERMPGIQRQFISALADRRGRLWFGAWWGLVGVEGGRFTAYTRGGEFALGSVRAFTEDRDGVLWAGTYGVTWRLDGGVWRRSGGPARTFLAEADGTFWSGADRGLERRRGGEVRTFTRADGLADDRVNALLRDRAGNLWVGTHAGLSRLRGEGFETGAAPPGLADQEITRLFEDREGNLWLGTSTAGLVRLRDGPFVSLAPPGTPHVGTAIAGTPDGAVWIGTVGGGLLRVAGGETKAVGAADGLCTETITTMAVDAQGRLWVGGNDVTPYALCRLEGGRFRALGPADGLRRYVRIRALLQGRRDFWVATNAELYRLDGDRLVREELPAAPAPAPRTLHSLHEDRRGVLWIGASDGLLRRDNGRWERVDERDGLPSAWPYALHEDAEGALWVGSKGVSRVIGRQATHFGSERGLFDDHVYGVAEDGERALWLCSSRGVFRVARADLDAVASGARARLTPIAYRAGDGLLSNTCEGGEGQGGIWRAPDGRLWFPTSRGAAYLDPRKLVRSAPPVVIEQVRFDGRDVSGAALASLGPGRGDLAFSYAALTFTAPEKVRYRHRLEPLERTWTDGDGSRSARYLALPSGRYRFRVEATMDGVARELSSAIDVRLLPRLEERWWFRALAALALAGLGAGAIALVQRARLRRLDERHQLVLAERTRMARELHDTFSQGFTALAVQLEAANRRLDSAPAKARENLDQARMLVRDSLTDARRAIWALRPQSLDGGGLASALTEIAGRLGAEAPVEVRLEGQPRRLAEPLEIALVRIGQEALTNAFKHARARRIELTVIYAVDRVGLRVSDDGAGFTGDADARDGHFGLRGIRERVDALGGRLEVHSRPGQGTQISVEVPA